MVAVQPVAGPSNPTVLARRREASRRRAAPPLVATARPEPPALVLVPRDSTTTSTLDAPVPTASYVFPAAEPRPALTPGLLAVLVLCGLAAAFVIAVTLYCCHRVGRRRSGMRPAQGTQRSVLADELRTWASKVNVVRGAPAEPKPRAGEPKRPARAASPIHPGLLHTPSRPSSFILDISGAKADPELDPWAAARVFTPASEPPNPFASAYVRSSESIARQTWAASPPAPAAVPLPRSPVAAHPALSLRTSSLARPAGPRSPASPGASPDSSSPHTNGTLPDLGYGPGSAFGGPGSARPGSSTHAPSVAGAASPHASHTYGAYDTHERPDWMPALPPATLSPVLEARTPRAADRFSAASETPARLSPIMWARPEAYAT